MKAKLVNKVLNENPEWTPEVFAGAKRAAEALSPELFAALTKRRPGERGPQKAPTKEMISIRLDKPMVEHFRPARDYPPVIDTKRCKGIFSTRQEN